jgi:hypothetical protein
MLHMMCKVHSIQFQLCDEESFQTFKIIKNIFKYYTILLHVLIHNYKMAVMARLRQKR